MHTLKGLIIPLFIFSSCSENNTKSQFINYRVDSFSLQIPVPTKTFQDPENYLISSGVDSLNRHVAIVYIPAYRTVYSTSLSDGRFISKRHIAGAPLQDCFSVFSSPTEGLWFSTPNKLLFVGKQDNVSKTIGFTANVDSQYYVLANLNSIPLNVTNQHVLLLLSSKSIMDRSMTLFRRYSTFCIGRFLIKEDKAHLEDSIPFPQSHRTKFHYSRFPFTAHLTNNIYYVFEDGDSIYAYNFVTKKSNHIISLHSLDKDYEPILMEEDSIYSIPYVIRNAIMSPGIRVFLFDPYRKVFYLGIKKKQSYLTEDGSRINDMLDYPFRILVLDEQFRKIRSVDFPKGRFKALYDAFVGEKGLYLMTNSKKSISYEVYDFGGAGSN